MQAGDVDDGVLSRQGGGPRRRFCFGSLEVCEAIRQHKMMYRRQSMLRKIGFLAMSALAGLAMIWGKPAYAADDVAVSIGKLNVAADTMWVLITGMLVFFMNLGFALVESGFQSSKNCVNILSKNFVVFAVTSIGFW